MFEKLSSNQAINYDFSDSQDPSQALQAFYPSYPCIHSLSQPSK